MEEEGNRVHALAVDDDVANHYVFRRVIEAAGAIPSVVATIAEARALLGERKFGCALIDKNLRGEDGLAFLRTLRELQPDCAAVMVTAYGNLDSAMEALRLGACDYVLKPFEYDELTNRIRLLLERSRLLTENKRLQGELVQSDRMAVLGTVAAGVVHEINNPLSYVLPSLMMVQDEVASIRDRLVEGAEDAALAAAGRLGELAVLLREIRSGVDHIRLIARDVKVFSRSGQGSARVELCPVIEAALKMASLQIRERAELTVEYRDPPAVVSSDAQLAQVFLNLLLNAAQALPPGRPAENTIRVCARDDGGAAVVEISDTGPGIAREVVPRLFEPFFTTKAAGEGTGLGLFISRRIVEDAGGRIEVESKPREGATFRVILPAVARERTRPRRGVVLFVSGAPATSSELRRAIAHQHDLVAVTSEAAGRAMFDSDERFDAVVWEPLNERAGSEAHGWLARFAQDRAARVLFLVRRTTTSSADAPSADRCLVRPVDPPVLLARLAEIVG